MRFGLLVKDSDGAREFARELSIKVSESGHTITNDLSDRSISAALIVGGDGTLLKAVSSMGEHQAPIIGVNMGGLGFLTEVTTGEAMSAIERFVQGKCGITRRMLIEVYLLRQGSEIARDHALNDVVITKGALARLMDFSAVVDKEYLASYRADGMIISTPTGSTAYSLSAGGPIISPNIDCILLSPICPHTLTHRPIVLSANSAISLEISGGNDMSLTVDGRKVSTAEPGDTLVIRRSPRQALIVNAIDRGYYEVLRSKLKWGGR